jgi:SNF2 family DNA or RNA helicase
MRGDLSRMIQHRSITYTADECVDLPPVVPIVEEVSFPTEAGTYYRLVVDQLVKAKGNYRAVESIFLRMRQVSSGFVGVKDDATGARTEIEFVENPKLERLLDLLEDLPEGRKAVVFYAFTWSGRKIVEACRAAGDTPVWLWSGTKDARAEITRFLEDPRCRTAVINNQVGAYALDGLQDVANYTFFYESPVSPIDREQAERRLERDGQLHRVFRYDLVVRGSMDQRILDFHREGEALMDALVRDPARAAVAQ